MDLIKIARSPAIVGTSEMTVKAAAQLMKDEGVGVLLIVDTQGKLLGVFSERDNLIRVSALGLDPARTVLGTVMSAPAVTASPTTSIMDGLQMMYRDRIRYLPIVDSQRRVLGVASIRNMLLRRIRDERADLEMLAAYVGAGGPG